MKHHENAFVFVCLLVLTFSFSVVQGNTAQGSQLTLLGEQHWETYGVGGTCSSRHNLFLKDLNGDGTSEIITGGSMYWVVNGSKTPSSAPLKVWNWNEKNFTLDASYIWNSTGGSRSSACVYAADVNDDGDNDVLTGGSMSNGSIGYAELAIWSWSGSSLVLDAHAEWGGTQGGRVNTISVSDLDKDGKPEIITGGTTSNDTTTSAQLRIWHIDGNNLSLMNSVEWCANQTASVNSLCVSDVDGNGIPEIVTAGYDHDLQNSTGQLRLWKWNGTSLTMEDNEEWQTSQGYMLNIAGGVQGNTVVNALGVGDADGNGKPDVVTGGFTYDGKYCDAQVVVWKWNGVGLAEVGSTVWHTQDINEVKSVSINDVDGDGKQEIVTSGVVAALRLVWVRHSRNGSAQSLGMGRKNVHAQGQPRLDRRTGSLRLERCHGNTQQEWRHGDSYSRMHVRGHVVQSRHANLGYLKTTRASSFDVFGSNKPNGNHGRDCNIFLREKETTSPCSILKNNSA